MADWVGMARTNYFRIKDESAFRNWAGELELVVITDQEGRFGFYSKTEDGGFPSWRFREEEEDDGEPQELDLTAELAAHIAEGSIAILMEIGHDKARYGSGSAIALNNEGKQVAIRLSDICEKAAQFFNVDVKTISEAMY